MAENDELASGVVFTVCLCQSSATPVCLLHAAQLSAESGAQRLRCPAGHELRALGFSPQTWACAECGREILTPDDLCSLHLPAAHRGGIYHAGCVTADELKDSHTAQVRFMTCRWN